MAAPKCREWILHLLLVISVIAVPGQVPTAGAENSVATDDLKSSPQPGFTERRRPGFRVEITELGSLGSGSSATSGFNRHGQVVGTSTVASGEVHTVLWEDGDMTDLGPGRAADINDKGQVIINREFGDAPPHALLWWRGTTTELGTLDGDDASEGFQINERGQVIGWSWRFGSDGRRAFLWERGVLTPLGSLEGCVSTAPLDINEQGQIVGWSTPDPRSTVLKAFLWQDGTMKELGGLGGLRDAPSDINDRGQIVGASRNTLDRDHAVLWDEGVITDLGTLGGAHSSASAINERGQIVGSSHTVSGSRHPFLWDRGSMTDLGTLPGKTDHLAWDINDRGQVVGYGRSTRSSNDYRGFVWQDGLMLDGGGGILREINEVGVARGNLWMVNGSSVTLEAYLASCMPTSNGVHKVATTGVERAGASVDLQLNAISKSPGADVALELALTEAMEVEANVYDISGRLVRRLPRGFLSAGLHRFSWDGRNEEGTKVRTGIYLVHARAKSMNVSAKVFRVH